MKNRFVYEDKVTGRKVYSDTRIKDRNLKLVSEVRDMRMKKAKIHTA